MTRKEAMRQNEQLDILRSLGFTRDEAEQLRRISMTLHRWHERECGDGNGCIERDETTNKPFWLNSTTMRRYSIPDRETGARKRLEAIIKARNERTLIKPSGGIITEAERSGAVAPYIQTDPRGAALYILRPGDVPEGKEADSYYSRGICIY